jgi:hypothetical protein
MTLNTENVLAGLKPYPITWSQLKQEMVKSLDYGVHPTEHNGWKLNQLTARRGWIGATRDEVRKWLRDGFKHEGLKVKSTDPYERSFKTRWNDWDGDPDLGRAVAGFDRYMFGRTKTTAKPALTVNFEYYFSAAFSIDLITQYGAWLAQLFGALEQRQYSLEVNAVAGINRDSTRGRVELQVKKHGERSDYTDWSAIFSPAGYRIIMFGAIVRACELAGVTANSGLGGAFNSRPGVTYDEANHTLNITCGNMSFNKHKLDADLIATGLLA